MDLIVSFLFSKICHCCPLPSTEPRLVSQGFGLPPKTTQMQSQPNADLILFTCIIHFTTWSHGSLGSSGHTLCLQLHPMLLLNCFLHQDCLSSLKEHFIHHPTLRFLRSVLMLLVRINISPLQAFTALYQFLCFEYDDNQLCITDSCTYFCFLHEILNSLKTTLNVYRIKIAITYQMCLHIDL